MGTQETRNPPGKEQLADSTAEVLRDLGADGIPAHVVHGTSVPFNSETENTGTIQNQMERPTRPGGFHRGGLGLDLNELELSAPHEPGDKHVTVEDIRLGALELRAALVRARCSTGRAWNLRKELHPCSAIGRPIAP